MTSWSISIKTVGSRIHHHGVAGNRNSGGGSGGSSSCSSSAATIHNDSTTANINNNNNSSGGCESNFTIQVNPDDPLHSLHDKIEAATGLTAEQQRLIYRGRIINSTSTAAGPSSSTGSQSRGANANGNHNATDNASSGSTAAAGTPASSADEVQALLGGAPSTPSTPSDDNASSSSSASAINNNNGDASSSPSAASPITPRVRDVNGLCDQQTIHLVPRPNVPSRDNTDANSMTTTAATTTNGTTAGGSGLGSILGGMGDGGNGGGNNNVTSLSGEAGMSLLAALLGVSGNNNPAGNNGSSSNVTNDTTTTTGGVAGGADGLGSIVDRAVMMGVMDEDPTGGGGGAAVIGIGGDPPPGLLAGGGGLTSAGLAAVLGSAGGGFAFGSSDAAGNANTTNNTNTGGRLRSPPTRESETFPRLAPLGSAARRTMSRRNRNSNASAAARARASAARLTEQDVRVEDPGNGEAVRQGLLTLHTLLGSAELDDYDAREHANSMPATESTTTAATALPPIRAPLDSHRQWYRGQWLDALDTVNQWLEATVVDIVLPEDILPCYGGNFETNFQNSNFENPGNAGGGNSNVRRRTRRATPDAVVSANDLEGRRRLLLEAIPDDEEEEDTIDNNGSPLRRSEDHPFEIINVAVFTDAFAANRRLRRNRHPGIEDGHRPRPDNDSVQLLLIHYNGWPHRWDEWIRSDSERIRTFRTRTRHRVGGSHAGPTPTAVFPAAPCTSIRDEEDGVTERQGMLEELGRVLGCVERLLRGATAGDGAARGATGSINGRMDNGGNTVRFNSILNGPSNGVDASHLPWHPVPPPSNYSAASLLSPNNPEENYKTNEDEEDSKDDSKDDSSDMATCPVPPSNRHDACADSSARLDPARLRQLAPLLDRLGRTLTDAAPHVLALADALPAPSLLVAAPVAAMDNADYAAASGINIDAAAAATIEALTQEQPDPIQSLAARASHLYFGVDGSEDEDADNNNEHSAAAAAENAPMRTTSTAVAELTQATVDVLSSSAAGQVHRAEQEQVVHQETTTIIDPDLTDYVNGMVNTSRGANGGRVNNDRSNTTGGGDAMGSSLLASYLSSMGGGLGGGGDGNNTAGNGGGGTNDNTRVIRMGGGGIGGLGNLGGGTGGGAGGPGIDIHIHAIVTGPGMTPTNAGGGGGGGVGGGLGGLFDGGGLGTATITAGTAVGTTAPRNNDSPLASVFGTASGTNNNNNNEEDDNLFSELYSESPVPVNLHGEDEVDDFDGIDDDADEATSDLNLLFEECFSIEEADSDDDDQIHGDNAEDDGTNQDEEVVPTDAEVAISLADNIPCLEADAVAAATMTIDEGNDIDDSGSSNSLSVLSEIESQDSTSVGAETTAMLIVNTTPTSSLRLGEGLAGAAAPPLRSPSLGSRLFRRTLGRLSGGGSSVRHSGSGGISRSP